jgi:hypothetical protein
MQDALNAGLAGAEGEGDFADTPHADMQAALEWVQAQLEKRPAPDPEREFWKAEANKSAIREGQWGRKP